MRRRDFLSSSIAAGISGTLLTSCDSATQKELLEPAMLDDGISGLSFEIIREHYRQQLFDQYLPFVENTMYDDRHGGFLTLNDARNGVIKEKSLVNQGQALWVYSYLYNNFGQDAQHLDIAIKTHDFMMNNMALESGAWRDKTSADGTATSEAVSSIIDALFAAHGLLEFSLAAENEETMTTVIGTIWAVLRTYDRPDYAGVAHDSLFSEDISFTGFRSQRYAQNIVGLLSQFLTHNKNSKFVEVLQEHADHIMKSFFNPGFGISNEYLNHDYIRIKGYEDHMRTAESIETMSTVMFDSIRQEDLQLFTDVKNIIHRYLELNWDYVYNGFGDADFLVFYRERRTSRNLYEIKTLWSHCELLIALLHIYEYTGDSWAKDWYERVSDYTSKTFEKEDGNWIQVVDRFGKELRSVGVPDSRGGIYHQPRYLMKNMLCLDRIIENAAELVV